MPKISVIVPIYNVSNYLDQCLESLVSQTFRDFEVIGVDDKSTDTSVEIFSKYMLMDNFRLIINYENQGLPAVRNLGIMNSTGDYLFFLDSDDWLTEDALQRMYSVALRDSTDIVIGGLAKYFDLDGSLLTPENHGRIMSKLRRKVDIFSDQELFYSVISCNKLIRSDFVKKNGLVFKTYPRRYEDMLTYKWYLSGAMVSNLREVTYYYRQRNVRGGTGSIMQDTSVSALTDKILAYTDIYVFVKEKGLLLTRTDPLHANQAMMNLPRALSWIYPKVYSDLSNNGSELYKFTAAAKQLSERFDINYVERLPKKIRETTEVLRSNDSCTAMNYCKELYLLDA